MKRALRNTDTSMFIKADLQETGLIEQARSFNTYHEAFEFCAQSRLDRVELVVRVSDRYEFTVEVPPPAVTAQILESSAADHPSAPDTIAPSPD